MQLRHGDNRGNGFCTSTCAYITALVPLALVLWFVCTCACAKPIPEIAPMVKLDTLETCHDLFIYETILKKNSQCVKQVTTTCHFRAHCWPLSAEQNSRLKFICSIWRHVLTLIKRVHSNSISSWHIWPWINLFIKKHILACAQKSE